MMKKPVEPEATMGKKPPETTAKADQQQTAKQKEIGGRDGPEPTRYGDWEKKGLISDF